ncbi:MAG TPA: alpha/beta hydrolase [Candidatus Woesebacteria bacterium]|nr:alpha/beta hydrolase [Candidatus Woesebacteria bacterium]
MDVEITIQNVSLVGDWEPIDEAKGVVLFVHESKNNQLYLRNTYVAKELQKKGIATLLFGLLTEEEDKTKELRFDIDLLTERLIGVTKWCMESEKINGIKIGYFGSGTWTAAALSGAAYWGTKIAAVVSWGGKPNLVLNELDLIEAPTLLITGGEEKEIIDLNRKAYIKLGCIKKMEIVPGATHLFEEPGAFEKIVELAGNWFERCFLANGVEKRIATNGQEKRSKQIA